MAYSLVSYLNPVEASASGFTTSAIDTTGADLLIVVSSFLSAITITDSKSNTWFPLTSQSNGGSVNAQIVYAYNAIVGTGHTISVSSAAYLGTIEVLAFSGSLTSGDPFDVEDGNSQAASASITVDSISPTQDNELLIVGASNAGVDAPASTSTGNGFTKIGSGAHVGGTAFGLVVGYLIQTSAGATGCQVTQVNSADWCGVIASFKAAAASSITVKQLAALGVG